MMQSHFMMFCEPEPQTHGKEGKERREEPRRALRAVLRWPARASGGIGASLAPEAVPKGRPLPLGAPSHPEPPCAPWGGTGAERRRGKATLRPCGPTVWRELRFGHEAMRVVLRDGGTQQGGSWARSCRGGGSCRGTCLAPGLPLLLQPPSRDAHLSDNQCVRFCAASRALPIAAQKCDQLAGTPKSAWPLSGTRSVARRARAGSAGSSAAPSHAVEDAAWYSPRDTRAQRAGRLAHIADASAACARPHDSTCRRLR